jgi:hypothetical protein
VSAKAIERGWQTLDTFIEDVASLASSTDDAYEITNQVAARLSGLLASDYRLPPEVTRPRTSTMSGTRSAPPPTTAGHWRPLSGT